MRFILYSINCHFYLEIYIYLYYCKIRARPQTRCSSLAPVDLMLSTKTTTNEERNKNTYDLRLFNGPLVYIFDDDERMVRTNEGKHQTISISM